MFLLGLTSVYLLFRYFFITNTCRDHLVLDYENALSDYLTDDIIEEKNKDIAIPKDPEFWDLIDN